MAAFLVRSNLSRGDLQLFLSNRNGYAQDAASVRWTVYARDGVQVSGKSLPAIRQSCGRYYAPWFTNVPNGNYKVVWEVMQEFGGPTVRHTEFIFVVDPSSYQTCGPINRDAIPAPQQFTFLTGQALGPCDLPLYLKNDCGFPQNAFAVFFTILDPAGNCLQQRTCAQNAGTGHYWAPYFVSLCSGNYTVLWEWQTTQNTPMKSTRCPFSVVDPGAPYSIVVPVVCQSSLYMQNCPYSVRPIMTRVVFAGSCEPCAGGCAGPPFRQEPCAPAFIPPSFVPTPIPPCPPGPGTCCGEVEVARTIHLSTTVLPPSGNFTNQQPYLIPDCIKKICFYVTYAYGAPGGYALLQLRWGNGTEEAQSTLIDLDFTPQQPLSFQNTYLQDLEGPIPASSAPITFMIEVTVPGGATTVRLVAAEGGVPGAPGTIGITLTASSE
jgi:hypothetical protein